jgi:hypothetical protein
MYYTSTYRSANTRELPAATSTIEIFKTDITGRQQAEMLINEIHKTFAEYKANVDLWDCDKILRIQSSTGFIQASVLIHLLKDLGCTAELLG